MSGDGCVVVVTGAAGGIGAASVAALLARGARVVATDARGDQLAALGKHPGLSPRELDVTSPAQVREVAEWVVREHGRVDALVNAAGVFARTPATALDEGVMRRILAVNLEGALRCTSVLGARMADRGSGRIVHLASVSAGAGAALASVYAASKAGLIAAARSAARELGPRGVRVNVVAPGLIDTEMLAPDRELARQFVVPRIPAGRLGTADEVAEMIAYLVTSAPDYLTGSVITLDGGLSVG
ncbi:MAG TPA: SDR family oxidoreductase [Myxococcales bacterium]|nr:SDR family oxidoreductase [Myxococcales bacterium]